MKCKDLCIKYSYLSSIGNVEILIPILPADLDSNLSVYEPKSYCFAVSIKNLEYSMAPCLSVKLWLPLLSCQFIKIWWRNKSKYTFRVFDYIKLYHLSSLKLTQKILSKASWLQKASAAICLTGYQLSKLPNTNLSPECSSKLVNLLMNVWRLWAFQHSLGWK